jgi:hypothetical protein
MRPTTAATVARSTGIGLGGCHPGTLHRPSCLCLTRGDPQRAELALSDAGALHRPELATATMAAMTRSRSYSFDSA